MLANADPSAHARGTESRTVSATGIADARCDAMRTPRRKLHISDKIAPHHTPRYSADSSKSPWPPGCEEACQDIGWNPGDKHKLRQDASCARVPLHGVIGTHVQNRNNRCARSHWNSFFFVLLYDTSLESVVTAATRGCGRPRSQVCVFFIVSTQTLTLYFHIRVEQVCADGSGSSTKPGL